MVFAIVVLTTLLGILLSKDKKKKMQLFSEIYEFNEKLLLNLKFGKVPISTIAQEFPYILKILQNELKIEGKDGEFINNYFKNLGHTDAISQIDYLNERKIYLKKYKDESFNDYKKYGSLYIKIFFMVGILVAVLLA